MRKALVFLLHMFLKQLVEDFTFEDVSNYFEDSKYFSYIRNQYSLTEEDELYFELLLHSDVPFDRLSLEVLVVEKKGLLPEVRLLNHEDELFSLKDRDLTFEEYAGLPVDLHWSASTSRGLKLITLLLLHQTFYKQLEDKSKRNRKSVDDDIAMVEVMELDDLEKLDELRQAELGNLNHRT